MRLGNYYCGSFYPVNFTMEEYLKNGQDQIWVVKMNVEEDRSYNTSTQDSTLINTLGISPEDFIRRFISKKN